MVVNQFHNHTFNIPGDLLDNGDGNPILSLLVPSLKKLAQMATVLLKQRNVSNAFSEGDSYLCYELDILGECPAYAVFQDEFTQRDVEELLPKRLCHPVRVLPRGQMSLLVNDDSNNLLCYEVNSKVISVCLQ